MMLQRQIFSILGLLLIGSFLASGLCSFSTSANNSISDTELNPDESQEARRLLAKLGYWTGSSDTADDEANYSATFAFQRVTGLAPTGILKIAELNALRHASPLNPHLKGAFHIEVDTLKQVLYQVNPEGRTMRILPCATGTGKLFTEGGKTRRAKTPVGTFSIYRKLEGWRQSPLGLMYYPSYIKGGVAIHGSFRFPARPSTYGCIAIPLFAAEQLSKDTPLGTPVVVY